MTSRSSFSLALVACLATCSFAAPPLSGGKTHVVSIDAGDTARISGISTLRSIDYGAFRWLQLDDTAFAALQKAGVAFVDHSDEYRITLGEVSFDPLVDATQWPAAYAQARSGGGKDLRLVQFYGPTRTGWLEALESDQIKIVQYIHPFTYVVYAESAILSAQRNATHVRWTGDFIPAFKVLPRWQSLADDSISVSIMLYRGADTAQTIRSIEMLGGKLEATAIVDDTFTIAGFSLSGAKLADAAILDGVYSIQPVPTDGGLRGEMSNQINAGNYNASNQAFPGYTAWLTSVGVNGAGVKIANVDGGVQESHPNLVNRFVACVGSTCSSTSSSHGTHTAGIMAADGTSGVLDSFGFQRGLGVAPGATLIEQVYSPWFQQAGGMLLLMTQSQQNGASLSGNSWGPAGTPRGYDGDTRQCDVGVRDANPNSPGNQPLTFVLSFMNGNGGTSTQGTPDEAKNIFNIGSTKMQNSGSGSQILQIDDLSANTAHGPALDGRTIPHMVAPGCYVDSTVPTNSYGLNCGTSMASPHTSGAVALFIQYYRGLPTYSVDPSPAMVKAAFLAVARSLVGKLDADGGILGHPFDSKQGWGRMILPPVLDPQLSVLYLDNPQVFDNTGEQWIRSVSAQDPSQPISIMLVWTDAPGHGLGGSTPAWNNNLDLTVESGAGVFRGNVFNSSGWSTTGGVADNKNNTEGVFIGPTAPDSYNIKVTATNINSDGVPNFGDGTDQDFAIVCYNCAQDPGFTISAAPLEQSVCIPSDAVFNVDVGQIMGFADPVDLRLAGEPAGSTESFSISPVTPPGTSVLTISNLGAAAPGVYNMTLTGTSGAIIRSAPLKLSVSASPPAAPGLISPANGITNQALRPNFTWSPDAQAVSYDIQIASDAGFTNIIHSASGLANPAYTPSTDLDVDTTYHWRVRASNVCGTGSYSAPFSFTTRVFPQILLVDDDDNGPDVRGTYIAALNALNRSFDIWDTNNTDNEPTAAQLSPYKIVIWFTGDEFGGFCGPGPAGEAALAAWLDTGKRLFISSQDYLFDRDSPTGVPTSFMQTYLGMASPGSNDVSQVTVTGAGSVFTGYGPYTLSYPFTNFSDRISPNATAELAFSGNAGTPNHAAISKNGGVYRTVFFGFPWEAISTPADRQAVMLRVLNWFSPQCAGLRGDMNLDGDRDGEDIDEFTACLIANDPFASTCGCADMDNSSDYSANDMTLFVNCLLDGPCP